MGASRILEPGTAVAGLRGLLILSGAIGFYACTGDTLYDLVAPGEAPLVEILSPSTGGQILAGQRVPILVTATDPDGISSITVRITGQVSETIVVTFTPPRASVEADTAFVVPMSGSGSVQISATATNSRGVEGHAPPSVLSVSSEDAVAPFVSLTVDLTDRMELTDEIRVTVRAVDNAGGAGIVETALTAIVSNTNRPDSFVVTRSESHAPASDTVESLFSFVPPFVDALDLPDTLFIAFFALATDGQGNCGGAVSEPFTNQVACDTAIVAGTDYVVAKAVSPVQRVIAVSGRTSLAPSGGVLADILIDTLRSRAYASNLSRNRINTLEVPSGSWGSEVFVGSAPWGLALNIDGDSLFVANSGGTSVSFVSLNGTPREDLSRRFVTQNTPLFEITRQHEGEANLEKLEAEFIDFSDRPQFLAQDAAGRLLFSTRPTSVASEGTIRAVTHEVGWDSPEARIVLLVEDVEIDTTKVAIAHVDSVTLFRVSGGHDLVEVFDHKPGFPDVLVRSGVLMLEAALTALSDDPDSDVLWVEGRWSRERLALRDTTFVTASGDREWVAFGEGGGGGAPGRITLWDASASRIHSRLLVADLLNNASERVTGLDLNDDGSLGAARGGFASYYWSTDLRLQGSVTTGISGGVGAAFHPDHPGYGQGTISSPVTVSFVGQGDHTVRILDTVHFAERGQLHIRDNVSGPLRAGPPLPSDNGGLGRNCGGSDCVVVKLYAITDAGGVVVIDVRNRDIEALQ